MVRSSCSACLMCLSWSKWIVPVRIEAGWSKNIYLFHSMKALLRKKKWRDLPGSQSSDPGQSLSSYHQKPSLLLQSIPTSHHTRATCALLYAWQISLLIGTLSYRLTLLHQYSVLCERAQDCISTLFFLQVVTLFHPPWLLKVHTGLCSDPVSFYICLFFCGEGCWMLWISRLGRRNLDCCKIENLLTRWIWPLLLSTKIYVHICCSGT